MDMLKARLPAGDAGFALFPPEVADPVDVELCVGWRAIRFDRSRLVFERLRVNVSLDNTVRMTETGAVTGMPLL